MSASKHEARASLLSEPGYDTSLYITHPGGYHDREGFVASTPQNDRPSWLYIPDSKWTWAFVGTTILQAVIGLALEGYIFAQFQLDLHKDAAGSTQSHTISAYLSLYIFGFIYQLVLVYDALRLKNTIQVIGLCFYNIGLLIEAAVQFDQLHDAVRALQRPEQMPDQPPIPGPRIDKDFWHNVHSFVVAIPIVIGVMTFVMAFLAWKLYEEFSWSIYKHISADLQLKKRYLSYQIYIALLKFDFFFFLAFTVQFLVVVINTNDAEFYLTIIAIPVTMVMLFLAAYWTRKESVPGMITIIVVYFAGMAYFLFKLVRMYDSNGQRERDYRPARNSLTTFAVITLLLLIVTIAYAIICTANFNKGLKPHVMSTRQRRRIGSQDMNKLYTQDVQLAAAGSSNPGRMTID